MFRFLSILIAFNVVTAAPELPFHYYSTADGLNQSQVTKIYQDHLGYIWFSTFSGIDRYDGVAFQHFSFYEHVVRTILEDSRRILWFGTATEGVYLLPAADPNDNLLQHLDTSSGLLSNTITAIAEDSLHHIWLGTLNHGLARLTFEKDNLATIDSVTCSHGLLSNNIFSLLVDFHGDTWCGTSAGVSCIHRFADSLHIQNFSTEAGLPAARVSALFQSPDSSIWVGTVKGLYFRAPRSRYFSRLQDLPPPSDQYDIRALWFDENDQFWIGTNGHGVLFGVLNPTRNRWNFMQLNTENGLPSNRVFNIMEDREHNLWFGTWGNGACKLLNNGFVKYARCEGKSMLGVYSIFQDQNRNLWFGTDGNGLGRLHKNQMQFFNTASGLISNTVWSIASDSRDQLWLGTFNGLQCYLPHESRFITFSTADDLPGNNVTFVFQDSFHHLWVSCQNQGLLLYQESPVRNGQKIRAESRHILPESAVSCILETKTGEIWLGASNGAYQLGKMTPEISDFNPQPQHLLEDKQIWCLYEDAWERLWFGSNGFGLYCFDGLICKRFTTRDGLCDNTIYFLQPDDQERLWVGTNRGMDLVRITPDSLIILQHFTTRDGLASNETNANCSLMDQDRNLWFGTVSGASRFALASEKKMSVPPLIYITGLRYSKYQISIQSPVELNYKQNYLTFSYLGLNFRDELGLKYQYKLEGFEDDWSELTNQREIRYTMLEPGSYVFQVRALNSDGIWSEQTATLPFHIAPPWWQLPVARFFGAILLMLSIWAIYEFRLRQIKRSRRLLQEKVDERTRALATSEQKYRTLIESSSDIIFTLDADGIFQTVNSTFQTKFGMLPEQVIGKSGFDFVSKTVNRQLKKNIETALNGEVVTFDWSHAVAGTLTEMETTLSPIREKDEKIVGVVGISRDVTERIRMARELKTERDKLKTILEAMEDMVLISAPDSRILYVNRAFRNVFPEIEVGLPYKELFATLLGTDNFEDNDYQITNFGESREFLDRKHQLWLGVIACPISLPEGECQLFILRNITERRYLEQERLNSERLAAVAQTTIAYNHEINNPLFGIMGYLEIMLQEETDSRRHEELMLIYDAAKRIADVTQRLKRLTRPAIREYVGSVKMLDLSGTNSGEN